MLPLQPIAIAGTGNVATTLAALLTRAGAVVCATGGRRGPALPFGELSKHSSHILIAVSDHAISSVAQEIAAGGLKTGVVLHTSGSAGPDALAVLRQAGSDVGVLHPLQSIPSLQAGVEALPGSSFAYAGDTEACRWALALIGLLGGKPLAVNAGRWQQYHAAAVIACNYHATLVESALELMLEAGIGRHAALEALSPLIQTTTRNILRSGPEAALTGPIRRGDTDTVRRHLASLHDPEIRALYRAAGQRTVRLASRAGLAEATAAELRQLLQDPK